MFKGRFKLKNDWKEFFNNFLLKNPAIHISSVCKVYLVFFFLLFLLSLFDEKYSLTSYTMCIHKFCVCTRVILGVKDSERGSI